MSDRDDYERLMLNLELMDEHLKKNVAYFKSLSEAEQDEQVNLRHAIEREIASRFSEESRHDIHNTYLQALKKAAPDHFDAESEADLFIGMLEIWGVYAFEECCRERQAHERRKEVATSFALSFSKMLDTASGLDDAALGYLLSSGFEQMAKDFSDETIPIALKGNAIAFMALANELKTTHSAKLNSFSAGIYTSLKDLPQIDRNSSSPEFSAAAALEDYLSKRNIAFSTTETGLAGKSFHSIMAMAGIEIGKAGYWLDKARKHENSWANFLSRFREQSTS